MFYSKGCQYGCLGVLLALAVIVACAGYYLIGSLLVVSLYVLNELLWSDHIYYDRTQNDDYQFSEGRCFTVSLENNSVTLPEDGLTGNETVFLAVNCQSQALGYLFDPYIDMQMGDEQATQYVERGVKGKRYLNISHLLCDGVRTVRFSPKHCRFTNTSAELLVFKNPDLGNKTLLVLAPHADDAEIAAFNLYSQYDSRVVTITAGESEPSTALKRLTKNAEEAQCLKGKLRAWDSIAVPYWAGVKPEHVMQLGYPDNSLQTLYANQNTPIAAEHKAVYRQFNTHSLATDNATAVSWSTLKQDLTAFIRLWQPDVIVTPHPAIDAHSDHQLTTQAIQDVVNDLALPEITFLYYVNHLPDTDHWPFGPHGTLVAPPPGQHSVPAFYSSVVTPTTQADKACSLEMMHDLRGKRSFKKQVRDRLQEVLLGRLRHPMGDDPYFRKAVRRNELFIVDKRAQ